MTEQAAERGRPSGAAVRGLRRALRERAEFIRSRLRIAREFAPFLRPHRVALSSAVLLSLAYAGLNLCEPWPLQVLIDGAVLGKDTKVLGMHPLRLVGGDKQALLLWCSGAVLVVAVLSGAVYYLQSILLARVGQDMVRDLRQTVFHKLQRLSLPYHQRSDSGDLLMRLTGDMILLREMIVASLVTMTTHLVVLFSTLALMISVSPSLTLVAVILAPLLYILFRFFRGKMVDAARQQRRREGRLASSLEEVLLAIPMIQAFTAEKAEDERFRQICKKSARAGLRGARLEAGMQRMVGILLALGTALVLWAGTGAILRGDLTPGLFLVFLAYLRGLYRPIRGLSKVAERTARATAASERIIEILHARREVKDARNAVPAPRLRGGLCFRAVDFSYQPGRRVLTGISFDIHPGERIALVGPTGAGKSTLVALLFRFYKPDHGKILVDGVPIETYTMQSLRRQISFLSQDPFILGVSVRENLLYGKPEATEEELWAALRAVGLDELVGSRPEGLDMPVRPRGQSLSGGQKQRLAVARALLKDSPILVLDEPTTGLDARSEEEVLQSLDRLREGRTTLTIAHHLVTIRRSDRIFVLEGGRLVESGPPQDLLSREGLFRSLADIQGLAPVAQP